jgi:hypothetical protein
LQEAEHFCFLTTNSRTSPSSCSSSGSGSTSTTSSSSTITAAVGAFWQHVFWRRRSSRWSFGPTGFFFEEEEVMGASSTLCFFFGRLSAMLRTFWGEVFCLTKASTVLVLKIQDPHYHIKFFKLLLAFWGGT